MKLYYHYQGHVYAQSVKAVADLAQVSVKSHIIAQEGEEAKDLKSKLPGAQFPILETESGQLLCESTAIACHIARSSPDSHLLGHSLFQEHQVHQWLSITTTDAISGMVKIYKTIFGTPLFSLKEFEEGVKQVTAFAKMLDRHLEERHFLVGESITVADVLTCAALIIPFQTVFDAEFREKHANVSEWFLRVIRLPSLVKSFGTIVPVHKALVPVDPKTAVAAPFVEKKVEEKKPAPVAETKKDDDVDEDDLFGDDDEDDKAAQEELKKKAAEAKAKKDKPKKVVIAKSLVLFEVKPYEAETKMEDMAKEILKIQLDGLWWKTEWKTEPIAYGVEKLIIGCTVEDDKVSVDDLQEMIEGLEDLVQSVEIIGFNKI